MIKISPEVETVEQKRPADIFQELLDYLWNGLGLEEKGWKRLKKGDFKKKTKNGLTYQIWFDRSHYNYIDYEIGHGNVEVGFSCIIKQGDDYLYSFRIEPTTGGSFFRMLTEDLRLDTGLLDTFLPLVKANYLDFIDRFEADPVEALQPVCAPFTEAEDYSWFIYVREQMVERYGTAEQMEEYRRQAELRGTPECKAKTHTGKLLFYQSHAKDVDHAWASSRTREELDQVVEPFVQAKRQTGQWTQEDEAGYQQMQEAAVQAAAPESTMLPDAPEQALDEYPMPDPMLTLDDLEKCGYRDGDMLPLSKERAMELYERDLTVYAVVDGGSAEMLFDREEFDTQAAGTMYAVSREEWEESPEFDARVQDRLNHQEERERAFLSHEGDCFAIYQVAENDPQRLRFMNMDWLNAHDLSVERGNYDLVYTAPLSETGSIDGRLHKLFEQFNFHRPADFHSPSMSVSDIVAIKRDGVVRSA